MSDPCLHSRSGEAALSGIGLDRQEQALLAILRHFCQSFAAPGTQGWMAAFDVAARHFGPQDGPAAVQAMLGVVRAMRLARPSVFLFSNPACPRCRAVVTANERQIMRLIHWTRRGRRSEAAIEAMLLCEGHDTAPLLREAEALAARFPCG